MQEFSTASVFEDTHGSTGYKWDDSSEFDSSEIDSDEQKLRVKLSELKRVVSRSDASLKSEPKQYHESRRTSFPNKNLPWQSTPQVAHHMHQMSGSTLANDISGQFSSPVKTDQKLPSSNGLETRATSAQKHKSSAGQSRVSTIVSPRTDEQRREPSIEVNVDDEHQRQMEINFGGSGSRMDVHVNDQVNTSANQEFLEEDVHTSSSDKHDAHTEEVVSTSSDEEEPLQHESPSRTPQKPFFIAGMNGLPERLRNEVMKYVTESVSNGRKVDLQDTSLIAEAVDVNALKELQALKDFLSSSDRGTELLNAFENDQGDTNSPTAASAVSRIGPETLPNKLLYTRLEMDKVEFQNKVALENILKNIMLQLELPFSAIPVGISTIARALAQDDYFREFASRVHETLYNEPMITANPECLDRMLEIIKK